MENFADDKVKIFDILRSIEEIEGLTIGVGFDAFSKQTHIKDEAVYQLREIGVASRLLSDEFKAEYGDVDWDVFQNLQFATWDQEIEVDPHGLWFVIENDLPRLKEQILQISTVLEDKDDSFFY